MYGGQYEKLRANIAALHPDMERWMVREGYGKVLGRPGLDLATRELCIVALLAPQDAGPQLYSHLRGALNAGADEALVDESVRLLLGSLPSERARAPDGTVERGAVAARNRSTERADQCLSIIPRSRSCGRHRRLRRGSVPPRNGSAARRPVRRRWRARRQCHCCARIRSCGRCSTTAISSIIARSEGSMDRARTARAATARI